MFLNKNSLTLFTFNASNSHDGLLMAMSTRKGGASQDAFSTLNLSFRVDDDPGAVQANRKNLCEALSVPLESIVLGQQVHGTHVALVTKKDRGKGATSWGDALPDTDAMVSNDPDLALMVLAADCAPVFLHDPVKQAIGIAHGSWRGTLGGIIGKTVARMETAFQCRPEDLRAGIGPSIGPCCYEVGEDLLATLRHSCPEFWRECIEEQASGVIHFNLWETIRRQLLGAGLKPGHVEVAGICTACHTEIFFSHRRERGRTGRNGAIIALRHNEGKLSPLNCIESMDHLIISQ